MTDHLRIRKKFWVKFVRKVVLLKERGIFQLVEKETRGLHIHNTHEDRTVSDETELTHVERQTYHVSSSCP